MANTIPLPEEPLNIPPLKPAVTFLDNQITEVHPKFRQLQPRYSAKDGKFVESTDRTLVAIDETTEMQRQREIFMKAVAKFEGSKDGIRTGVRLDVSTCHGWNDVMHDLQSIESKYSSRSKDEGIAERIRKSMRSMRKLSSPCEQWLKLLPSESWQGSLLCGGIKIVLTAASTLNLVHEEIVESIDDIPLTIEVVFKLSRLYDTEAMQSHVSQLFVAILELLEECLVWLKKNPFRKGLSAAFRGEEHASGLKQKRKQLSRLTDRIDTYSKVGLHEKLHDMDERARSSSDVLNYLHDFVKDGEIRLKQARAESARQQKRREAAEKELHLVKEIQKQKYLESVNFDPAKPVYDLMSCARASPLIYVRAQDRAAWILRSGQISVWLLDSRSQVLVINSCEANHDRDSPVSLFSAMLVQSLVKARAGTILYWSCGQNVHGNTEELVRHMVGQLLQEQQDDMSSTALSLLMSLETRDFEAVLEVFIQLLEESLETAPLFLVLDSISFFEDKPRATETRHLFDVLHTFIDQRSDRHPLKVLATSPTKCNYLGTFLDDWKPTVVSVPEVVEGDRLRRMSLALPRLEPDEEDESTE